MAVGASLHSPVAVQILAPSQTRGEDGQAKQVRIGQGQAHHISPQSLPKSGLSRQCACRSCGMISARKATVVPSSFREGPAGRRITPQSGFCSPPLPLAMPGESLAHRLLELHASGIDVVTDPAEGFARATARRRDERLAFVAVHEAGGFEEVLFLRPAAPQETRVCRRG